MYVYILTHRMHRLIGISSAAVQYINIHVYIHIFISSNINNLQYVRHYGWVQLYNAASLVTQNDKSDVYASFLFTFLLMQDQHAA